MLRFLLWRLLGLLALLAGLALVDWFLHGGPGRLLRGSVAVHPAASRLLGFPASWVSGAWSWTPRAGIWPVRTLLVLAIAQIGLVAGARWRARNRRSYVRLRVETYRTDEADAEAVVKLFGALHKRLLHRWWRRLLLGQPSVALEVHHEYAPGRQDGAANIAWLAVSCPRGSERMIEAALRTAYPNCRLSPIGEPLKRPAAVLRLKKGAEFIKRVKSLDHFEYEREPPLNRLLTVMGACRAPALVQIALTPTPALFERFARHLFKLHEERLSRERRALPIVRDRSMVEDAELRGGLDVQHRPLFYVDIRVAAVDRRTCEQVASELRAESAENRLVERGTAVRHGLLSLYSRRLQRGEGNAIPPWHKGVFATTEVAALWHLPSIDYATVPFARGALPLAPAPPSILRPREGQGTLRDAIGAVSIHPDMRRQNTAVPGAVEQGKSSYLIATVAEDLQRERCAVIVLDPKGDAADAAVGLVPATRTCTLLDFARPTCGFNPLAVDAPADVIADYVVAALKNLFTDADIRASSDRYLRNAIIAVLAYDRASTLWDAARLLSVGEEGYSYRSSVGSRVRTLPEFKEISEFFTAELVAQLADARNATRRFARSLREPASADFVSPATRVAGIRRAASRASVRISSTSASTARAPTASAGTPARAVASASMAAWSGASGRRPMIRSARPSASSRTPFSFSTALAAAGRRTSPAPAATAEMVRTIASWPASVSGRARSRSSCRPHADERPARPRPHPSRRTRAGEQGRRFVRCPCRVSAGRLRS